MAQQYFDNFPAIKYKNKEAKNILLRVGVRESTLKPSILFMPLTVQEYERPDTVANDLYEQSVYDWTVRLVNKQIDPYYHWYLPADQLEKNIIKKYGSLAAAYNTILYYKHNTELNIFINNDTYDLLSTGEKLNYSGITAYVYETDINELKKNILVVSPNDVDEMERLLEAKLNE
jgi:hypothetical protein